MAATVACGSPSHVYGADVRLTDEAVLAYASAPLSDADKERLMFKRIQLGTHNGLQLVADHPCGDVCPDATGRIVHYDLKPGPDCIKAGGAIVEWTVPMGIAVGKAPFCVPAILASRTDLQ